MLSPVIVKIKNKIIAKSKFSRARHGLKHYIWIAIEQTSVYFQWAILRRKEKGKYQVSNIIELIET